MPVAVQLMTSSAALAPNEGNEIGEETSSQNWPPIGGLLFFHFFPSTGRLSCIFIITERGGSSAAFSPHMINGDGAHR
jgi:hypothetical protein